MSYPPKREQSPITLGKRTSVFERLGNRVGSPPDEPKRYVDSKSMRSTVVKASGSVRSQDSEEFDELERKRVMLRRELQMEMEREEGEVPASRSSGSNRSPAASEVKYDRHGNIRVSLRDKERMKKAEKAGSDSSYASSSYKRQVSC